MEKHARRGRKSEERKVKEKERENHEKDVNEGKCMRELESMQESWKAEMGGRLRERLEGGGED